MTGTGLSRIRTLRAYWGIKKGRGRLVGSFHGRSRGVGYVALFERNADKLLVEKFISIIFILGDVSNTPPC